MDQSVIQPLSLHPQALDQLALWHHRECLRQGLESSLERRRDYLARHLGPEPLPYTLVALEGTESIGCVSLVRYQSATSPSSPQSRVWLSNLYVAEPHRRRGLGQKLLESASSHARQLHLPQLWLFTDRHIDYYQKRGWQPEGKARVGKGKVQIMFINLLACINRV